MSTIEYVAISVIVRARTTKGAKLSPVVDQDHSAWIGRKCIHPEDDMEIDACKLGDELEVRIEEWLAKKESMF